MMKVCFVVPYGYPLINKSARAIFGGAEVRAITFASGLARDESFSVCVVVKDEQGPGVEHAGRLEVRRSAYLDKPGAIRALRPFLARKSAFPFVQVRKWGLAMLWLLPRAVIHTCVASLMRNWRELMHQPGELFPGSHRQYAEIGADIYCTFGVSEISADLARFTRRAGKKFALFLASEYDLSEIYRPSSRERNMYGAPGVLCYESIAHADIIIAQTEIQRRLLASRFARSSVLVRNPVPFELSRTRDATRDIALWVGKADKNKRPELLLQLAREFPKQQFVMVMNMVLPEDFKRIASDLPGNVMLLEQVMPEEAEQLFQRALVFINTSGFEGFPNTYLQAGKHSTPILSMAVDPDDFISSFGCGIVAGNRLDSFVSGFDKLITDESFRNACSRNIHDYVVRFHELGARLQEVKQVFSSLASGERLIEEPATAPANITSST